VTAQASGDTRRLCVVAPGPGSSGPGYMLSYLLAVLAVLAVLAAFGNATSSVL
jgi:hypothetical protein